MSQLVPVIMRIMTLMAVLRIIYGRNDEMSDNEGDVHGDGADVLHSLLKVPSALDTPIWCRLINSSWSREH